MDILLLLTVSRWARTDVLPFCCKKVEICSEFFSFFSKRRCGRPEVVHFPPLLLICSISSSCPGEKDWNCAGLRDHKGEEEFPGKGFE